ncbi:MAG: fumarylacetoacetate hydrolase family protein [Bacteroidia bacterium]|nr:fumarylacetoacetate hydrolase family protein [Bacteroidia bacterium]
MKIICIGRNYTEHAAEMKAEVPEKPVFFLKPETALHKGYEYLMPEFTQDLHYEAELVFRISKPGKSIEERFAMGYVDAFTVGLDLTARDLQAECKKKGLPWEIAKAFDFSAIVGEWLNISEFDIEQDFHLNVNNQIRQKGKAKNMLFTLPQIVSYVSKFITLKIGDMIFTGTPEGVGKINGGDVLEGFYGKKSVFKHVFR